MTDALTLNPLAVTNADVLRALEIEPPEFATVAELARYLKRDKSNLNKTLKSLASAGLVGETPLADRLTDAGRAQLAAIGRAEQPGRVGSGGPEGPTTAAPQKDRWPLDKIIRNPANRTPWPEDVAALADTIEAAGDVLQNVQLTPPDANGVRMLLAGEHRWLAAQWLEREGRLPHALADGLPFTERRASAAEQILIRIVENTARADLSPLEDARLLRDLQVHTGWSAREVAKKTGRSPADSEAGVRDVQLKIKIAREATPEAIAEYERTGSWDALRDSVSKPKAPKGPEAPANPHLALFLAEAALLADDVEGVWDGTLMLEPGLQWPVSWEDGWFSWHAETGRFALEDKATRWLAAADLGEDPGLLLAQLRAAAGVAAQQDARPWANATLRDVEARMKGGGTVADAQTDIEDVAPPHPSEVARERIARLVATYTLPNPKLPKAMPLLKILIGEHADGTWTFATASTGTDGCGTSYGLGFVGARTRAIETRAEAVAQAVAELRARSGEYGDTNKRNAWLDAVLTGEVDPVEPEAEAVAGADEAKVTFHDFYRPGDPTPVIRLQCHTLPDGRVGWGWNVANLPGRTDPTVAMGPTEFLPNGPLAKERAIKGLLHLHREGMMLEAVRWLDRQLGPHFVDGVDCYNAPTAAERRRALGWEPRLANSGGGSAAKKAEPETLQGNIGAGEITPDRWGAALELLARDARAVADDNTEGFPGWTSDARECVQPLLRLLAQGRTAAAALMLARIHIQQRNGGLGTRPVPTLQRAMAELMPPAELPANATPTEESAR